MALKLKIRQDMIVAMKAKDQQKLNIVRLILSFINNKEIDLGIKGKSDLNDDEVIKILKSMVKSRENLIAEYKAHNDTDAIEQENKEINLINEFLPTPYTKEETELIIKDILLEIEAKTIKDMGRVMAQLNTRDDNAKFNKAMVATIIKDNLG